MTANRNFATLASARQASFNGQFHGIGEKRERRVPDGTVIINTSRGLYAEAALAKTVVVEDRPDALVLRIEWRADDGDIVRSEAYPLPKVTDAVVTTIVGDIPRAQLERSVRLFEQPANYVVTVEWRLDGDVVRTDPNVVLKDQNIVAGVMTATFG